MQVIIIFLAKSHGDRCKKTKFNDQEFRNIVIHVKLWKFHLSKHLTLLHFIVPFPLKIQIKVLKRLIYNAFTVNGIQYSQFIVLDKELTRFEIIKGKLLTRIGHQWSSFYQTQ